MLIKTIGLTAQTNPAGNTYVAQISAACKEMRDGGCMIYNYCVLKFKKSTVEVSYYTKAECTPKSREKNYEQSIADNKTYEWTMDNNLIYIKGFDEYGPFKNAEQKLVGQKKMNGNLQDLEFIQKN